MHVLSVGEQSTKTLQHIAYYQVIQHFNIHLLAFYHKCRNLIVYATLYLFLDR